MDGHVPFCYFNGSIVPVSEARVGVYDVGLLRGFGIYEALATANRKPFMFEAHMARFHHSTERLSLSIPASDSEIESAIMTLVERNVPRGEAVVRIIITGGEAIGGIEYDRAHPTFYILVEPLRLPAPETYTQGARLMTYEYERQFPEYKTINYIQAVLLQDARKAQGALEILYTHAGAVFECATSNFFIVKDGVVVTPKEGILGGITRRVAIDVARAEFSVEERSLAVAEMFEADEAFLTSSFKDVVPVTTIDGKAIGSGSVGPVTTRIMELFKDFHEQYGKNPVFQHHMPVLS